MSILYTVVGLLVVTAASLFTIVLSLGAILELWASRRDTALTEAIRRELGALEHDLGHGDDAVRSRNRIRAILDRATRRPRRTR